MAKTVVAVGFEDEALGHLQLRVALDEQVVALFPGVHAEQAPGRR